MKEQNHLQKLLEENQPSLKRHLQVSNWLDTKINSQLESYIYSRAALNISKIAGILAVGKNFYDPTINHEMYDWALSFVWQSMQTLLEKESAGKIKQTNNRSDYGDDYEVTKEMTAVLKQMYKTAASTDVIKEYALFRHTKIIEAMNRNNSNYGIRKISNVLTAWCDAGYIRRINNDEWKSIASRATPNGRGGFQIVDFGFFDVTNY